MNNILKIMEQLPTFRTSCRSCGGSMQVSILRSRSMIADVPMCLIIKSTKSTCFCRKSTIYRIIIIKKKLHHSLKQSKTLCIVHTGQTVYRSEAISRWIQFIYRTFLKRNGWLIIIYLHHTQSLEKLFQNNWKIYKKNHQNHVAMTC